MVGKRLKSYKRVQLELMNTVENLRPGFLRAAFVFVCAEQQGFFRKTGRFFLSHLLLFELFLACSEKLSEEGRAVRCPSFSPDFSRLVYLDTPEGGAHNQCSRLMMVRLDGSCVCDEDDMMMVRPDGSSVCDE